MPPNEQTHRSLTRPLSHPRAQRAKPAKKPAAPRKPAAAKKAPTKAAQNKRPAPASDDEDDSITSNSKKQKKIPAKPKPKQKPIDFDDSGDGGGSDPMLDVDDGPNGELAGKKKTSSDKYQKVGYMPACSEGRGSN